MAKRCSAHCLTKLAPSALGFLCAGALCAQQIPAPPSPPAPPTVSAPTVSPVTAPKLGSGPTGPAGSNAGAAGSASGSGSGSSNAALAMSSLLGDSSNSLLSSLLGEDTDATGTTDDELLGKLMSLLQGGSGATAATAASAPTPATTAAASAEKASAGAPRVGVASVGAGIGGRESASGADIARFTLGAYDVTPTITLLLSSNIAANGAFLLSGDRAYLSSGKTLRETFYFLCRKEADGSYVLHADVAQETANEWSACRRLARLGAIRGEQAGNQILFRASDSVGPMYLLLSLFGPSAGR